MLGISFAEFANISATVITITVIITLTAKIISSVVVSKVPPPYCVSTVKSVLAFLSFPSLTVVPEDSVPLLNGDCVANSV